MRDRPPFSSNRRIGQERRNPAHTSGAGLHWQARSVGECHHSHLRETRFCGRQFHGALVAYALEEDVQILRKLFLPYDPNRGAHFERVPVKFEPIDKISRWVPDRPHRRGSVSAQLIRPEKCFGKIICMFELRKRQLFVVCPLDINARLPLSKPRVKAGFEACRGIACRKEIAVGFRQITQTDPMAMAHQLVGLPVLIDLLDHALDLCAWRLADMQKVYLIGRVLCFSTQAVQTMTTHTFDTQTKPP